MHRSSLSMDHNIYRTLKKNVEKASKANLFRKVKWQQLKVGSWRYVHSKWSSKEAHFNGGTHKLQGRSSKAVLLKMEVHTHYKKSSTKKKKKRTKKTQTHR